MIKPPELTKHLPHKTFKQFCLNLDYLTVLFKEHLVSNRIQKLLSNIALGTQGRYARTDEAARDLMKRGHYD